MASGKPKLPNLYLGTQKAFGECKLRLESHTEFEFKVVFRNTVVVKLGTEIPVKVTSKLTQVSTEKEFRDQHVFVQRKDGASVHFHVGFPKSGWYKFEIFALPEKDSETSLPNVVNYLINVDMSHKPAQPFPKAYDKFYTDYCYLEEPLILNSSTPALDRTHFLLTVPGALRVAVKCKEEWFNLDKKGGQWEGTVNLMEFSGKDTKAVVGANYDEGTNTSVTYDFLLEYTI